MVKLNANAKLNLSLFVGDKNENGYHEIKSLAVPLELHDTIIIKKSQTDLIKIRYKRYIKGIIEGNIIEKALSLFRNEFHIYTNVKIILIKRIPLSSGLGGESTDGSTTLLGLIKYFNLNVDETRLSKMALMLGTDTLFCLSNKPALIEGHGDKLTFVDSKTIKSIVPSLKVTLFFNKNYVSTKEAFVKVDEYPNTHLDTNPYFFSNDFLQVFLENKENNLLYEQLKKEYLAVYLSGSGNCLYVYSHKKSKVSDCLVKKNYIKLENIFKIL